MTPRPRADRAGSPKFLIVALDDAILTADANSREQRCLADVGAVDQESPLATVEAQVEPGDRCVGDRLEGGAQTAADRFDLAVEVDVDLAVEGGDEVGEAALVFRRGAQVDRAFERLFKQRGFRPCGADDRAGRAFVGGELNLRAWVLDVGVVDDLRGGQRHRGGGDVCFTGLGAQVGAQGWVAVVPGRTGELQSELGSEGEEAQSAT